MPLTGNAGVRALHLAYALFTYIYDIYAEEDDRMSIERTARELKELKLMAEELAVEITALEEAIKAAMGIPSGSL